MSGLGRCQLGRDQTRPNLLDEPTISVDVEVAGHLRAQQQRPTRRCWWLDGHWTRVRPDLARPGPTWPDLARPILDGLRPVVAARPLWGVEFRSAQKSLLTLRAVEAVEGYDAVQRRFDEYGRAWLACYDVDLDVFLADAIPSNIEVPA